MARVRFAPSPTGFLHIGGARTALFNWMYARAQNGKFVLRIEDTDQQRSKKEFEEEILRSMKWLGMDWDELYYQSDRFDKYREIAQKLVDEGKAYKDGEAILLKTTKQDIKIYDLIRGEIIFDTANFVVRNEDGSVETDSDGQAKLKDEVLIKGDGSPAYNFCCVIDDASMEISPVIRGEDHISNTPKQILIYNALGFKIPKFAHLPLIMGEDGTRMSKRTGAVAVSDYKEQGFLPEALVNYLMLLGWSPGNNKEIVGLKTAIKSFSIKKVNKASAMFSMEKLRWVNAQYIKQTDTKKLTELLIPFLKESEYISDDFDRQRLESIVELFKVRLSTLKEFVEWTDFLFIDELNFDTEAKEKHLSVNKEEEFGLLSERFQKLEFFSPVECENAFKATISDLGIKPGELVHPLRVALTGRANGPSLFDSISLLGKEQVLSRLKNAFNH